MSFMTLLSKKFTLPSAAEALPGRPSPIISTQKHAVNNHSLIEPFPDGSKTILLGMGCFWGAERLFWQQSGVWVTAVGYAGGHTPHPTYNEVCTGRTGHTEVVQVVFDPSQIALTNLLTLFWEHHDPTQGMRQGNDTGTQYRSAIYVNSVEDMEIAEASRSLYNQKLVAAGFPRAVTTEIKSSQPFYYAEEYHQQYLHKNPQGYCGLKGTGVACTPEI